MNVKRNRWISIAIKLDATSKLYERIKLPDIAREMKLPETTISLIKNNEVKIKECSHYVTKSIFQRISHPQHGAIHNRNPTLHIDLRPTK